MAKGFSIQVQGLEQVQKRFTSLPGRLKSELNGVFEDTANEFAERAKSETPGDEGSLRRMISSFKEKDLNYAVVSGADYSAFVEFGTRGKTRIPAGLEQYAAQFKGRNDGLQAKAAIYEWCRRKGIDPKFWYPIYVSLMVKGITPQPFFFKQLNVVKPKLIKNIQQVARSL